MQESQNYRKTLDLLQSKDFEERKIGVLMLIHWTPEQIISLTQHSNHCYISGLDWWKSRMLLHSFFHVRYKGEEYHHLLTCHVHFETYLSEHTTFEDKGEAPWLGLLDIERLSLDRGMIAHFGIHSSIDDWEKNYNSGQI